MRKHKLAALILTLVMVASLFAGCGSSNTSGSNQATPTPTKAASQLDADQTIHLRGYDYKSLDTAAESDAETFTTYTQVFEGLYRETAKGNVPALAQDTKVSADGLTYTFTLRDAKWSDGKPVTANDFEFAWKRLIDPANAFDYEHFIDMVKGVPEYIAGKGKIEDVGIKAVDAKTLQVTLSTPTPYFTALLSFSGLSPQREDIFKALGKDYGQSWDKLVYDGPFTISNYQKGSVIEYTKNANYWDAANVKLNKAVCNIVDEPATQVQMFQAKQWDQVQGTGDAIAQLDAGKTAGGYNHIIQPDGSVFYILFGMKNKSSILQNLKVRQAMIAAFDKKAFLDATWKSNMVAGGIVSPGIQIGSNEYRKVVEEPQPKFISTVKDPKALFMDGLKELGITDPSTVTLKMLLGPQSSIVSAQGQFVQNQFQSKFGIKVEIQYSVDSPTYFQQRTAGDFDLCLGGWGPDYNDVSTYYGLFTTGDGNNNGKYSDAKYDELVKGAAKEMDSAKRQDMYKQAEQILTVDDPAMILTYYRAPEYFRYNWVKDLYIPTFGGYYSLKNAYIQGRK